MTTVIILLFIIFGIPTIGALLIVGAEAVSRIKNRGADDPHDRTLDEALSLAQQR